MEKHHKQCLLLNADYSPLSIISWQKAIIWSIRFQDNYKYGIEIIDFYKNDYINGVDKKYPIPAVAKTHRYLRINSQDIKFSRKNIFIRDNYTCQYCGKQYYINNLTYDHVVPKSKWKDEKSSPTCWTNIVTACIWCNRKKANKTPKEAEMPLRNLPIKPNKNLKYLPIVDTMATMKETMPSEWLVYLPQSFNQ
jgi:5-methylcytosine-specific restriction endonuclease McrA